MTTPAPANALETVMLIQVDARVNHNKFYELSKLPDGNTLARWGRVGAGAQSRVYPGHHSFTAKRNEKLAKGYVEFGTSDRAGTAAPTNRPDLHKLVTAALLGVAGGSADLVSHLIGANRHAIDTATGGRIAVSDTGAVTTALGPVSLAQIARARRELATLRKGYDRPAVESYLTLIPRRSPACGPQTGSHAAGAATRMTCSTPLSRQSPCRRPPRTQPPTRSRFTSGTAW